MPKIYLCKTYGDCVKTVAKTVGGKPRDFEHPCLIFSDDRLTMNLEKEIADRLGGSSSAEVYTFNRFSSRFVRKTKRILSREGSVMCLRRIIGENAKSLSCFKNSLSSPNFAKNMYELIAQLKSASVTPDMLKTGDNFSVALKGKLADIELIFRKYEEYLVKNDTYDGNAYLEQVKRYVESSEDIEKYSIIFCGYTALTKQTFSLIQTFVKRAASVEFVLLSGENEDCYINETFLALKRVISDLDVETVVPESKEAEIISDMIFNADCFGKSGVETDNVFVYEANSVGEEIEHIARLISLRIKSGRAKYKDVNIALGSAENYRYLCESIFGEYQIPYYFDEKIPMTSHPLCRLILSFLNVRYKNFSIESVCELIKNPLYTSSSESADKFIDYILKFSLTPKNLKKPFEYKDDYCDLELVESMRRRLIEDVELPSSARVDEYIGIIKAYLEKIDFKACISLLSEKLYAYSETKCAGFNDQAADKTEQVFEELSCILGDVKLTIKEFIGILSSGFAASEVSLVPQNLDVVYVGDITSGKFSTKPLMFAAGLNGDVPFIKSDCAILNDRDIDRLKENGCDISPKISIVNLRGKENVGATLCAFSKTLFLSYSTTGINGAVQTPSRVLNYIQAMFSEDGGKLKSSNALSLSVSAEKKNRGDSWFLYQNMALKPAMRNLFQIIENAEREKYDSERYSSLFSAIKDCDGEKLDKFTDKALFEGECQVANAEKLFFGNGLISSSTLENHFACPYKCFMDNGIKVVEREDGNVKSNRFGNFLHSVLERYVKNISVVSDISDNDKLVDNIIEDLQKDDEYGRYLQKDEYLESFRMLSREAKRVCYKVKTDSNNSEFKSVGQEVWFGDDSKFKAIELPTDSGVRKLQGKVDRIDEYKNNIRIIDYKSGKIDDSNESFFVGTRLQLYLYANAFCHDGKVPAGVYYYAVNDDFKKEGENAVLYKGKTLNDLELIDAADKSLADGNVKSDTLGVTMIFKEGKREAKASNGVLSRDRFDDYLKYARAIAINGAEELADGMITPSPYGKTCSYCKYNGICGYDPSSDKRDRRLKGINAETLRTALEEEKDS